jgi:hypothetical protein
MTQFLMSEYLSTVSADYAYTLQIAPQNQITILPIKSQSMLFTDDNNPLIINSNDSTKFIVELEWDMLKLSDSETIMELWCDNTKANGIARSFRWYNHSDTKTYVTHYMERPILKHFASGYESVIGIKLLILGNYNA